MLGVEHLVDGRQADVLVDPAITGGEMHVQHLVVVGPGRLGREIGRRVEVAVGHQARLGLRVVRDVGEEGGAEVQRVGRHRHRRGDVALDEPVGGHVLRQAGRAGEELPVGVGREHRDVGDVGVNEREAEKFCRLLLDGLPGRHAARGRSGQATEQLAGRHRDARGVVRVLAQEDLVRGVRGVGLALVDQGGVRVLGVADVVCRAEGPVRAGLVGGAGQDHEAQVHVQVVGVAKDVVRSRDQRVVGLQRHEDRAATLDRLVHTVVEELTEQREERVVRRRESDVGRHVGDEQRLVRRGAVGRHREDLGTSERVRIGGARDGTVGALAPNRETRRGDSGRVGRGLVHDEVADHAGLGIEDEPRGLEVAGGHGRATERPGLRGLEDSTGEAGEQLVGCPERLLAVLEVVARAVHGAQPEREQRAGDLVRPWPDQRAAGTGRRRRIRDVRLGDLDLLENEGQVRRGDGEALPDRRLNDGESRCREEARAHREPDPGGDGPTGPTHGDSPPRPRHSPTPEEPC